MKQPARPGPEERLTSRFSRLPLLIGVVGTTGAVSAALALAELARSSFSGEAWAGIGFLLCAALLAERFPVPITGVKAGGVSLAAVFIVAAGYLDGWAPAVLIACATRGLFELAQRRPAEKLIYNCATYGLAAGAAGLAAHCAPHSADVRWLIVDVLAGSVAFYVFNVVLVAAVIACATRQGFVAVLAQAVSSTVLAFAIMFSVCLMLAGLWQRSPILSVTLLGPLLAIALYQRSANGERLALELALTDSLTGLGNYRRFRDRLERLLDESDESGLPFSLCVLDLDEFKAINDSHGHPSGDRVLAELADCIRNAGEGFRLGGDEFALLLPGGRDEQALATVAGIVTGFTSLTREATMTSTVSVGIASYPAPSIERGALVRAADRALYSAKASGKNAVRVYKPDVIELSERRVAEQADRRARLNAASCLARALEVRDAYTGDHSEAVGALAARLAAALGLSSEEVELIRLAGRVHDLGKLAIAEEVLCKPAPLNSGERQVIKTHSEIGYRMLSSLGIDPVASWVLHHHERWDGLGYPSGLRGEAIPIGSRILFVADAYQAMTTDRIYRNRISHEEALAEIERCSGIQFDPDVVEALVALSLEGSTPRPVQALAIA
jgi:diguanylate cyclase (GGDEF)-like protein